VLQGGEDRNPAAEMRIGLKYMRQLGDPDTGGETSHMITRVNTMPLTSVSFTVPARPYAQYEWETEAQTMVDNFNRC
jgi:hypothetical protein